MENMTIKEAGRYANFLDEVKEDILHISRFGLKSKLFKEEEYHKKSEAYKEAEDKVIEVEHEDVVDCDIKTLTKVLNNIVSEKALLAASIFKAKKLISIKSGDGLNLDLDSAIEYAKILRNVADCYYFPLTTEKNSKEKETRRAYAFNVEGNQTPYYYEVEITKELLYDKKEFINSYKETKELADKISQKIDMAMSEEIVEFKPRYNYLDTVKEIVEK